ncbi:MAG TPA: transporter substrate-binding domain-containing protein [Burkholderiaceae bacterium]
MTKLPLYFALLLLPCLHAPAAGAVTLRTEVEADASMKWVAGGTSGICPEVLRAISRKDPGIEFAWSAGPVPQKRVVAEAETGRIDVVCGLGRTPEREQQLVIPAVVLYDDTLVAAVRAGDPLRVSDLAELKKLPPSDTVLLTHGARLVGRLAELGVRQVDEGARSPADNLEKLVRGRGRVFLFHEPGMAWEIRQAHLEDKVEVLPAILSVDQHYLMLSRRVPSELVKRITAALTALKNDGTLHDIAARWSPGLRRRHGALQEWDAAATMAGPR